MQKKILFSVLGIFLFTNINFAITKSTSLTVRFGAANDNLGCSVDICENGSIAVVGADGADVAGRTDQGAAYIYDHENNEWNQNHMLISDDGSAYDQLGISVATSQDGSLIAAGSPGSDGEKGAVYLFEKDGDDWEQIAKLTYSSATGDDSLGYSVSLSDDGSTLIAGMPGYDGASDDFGAIAVFTMPKIGWNDSDTPDAILTASDGERFDYLGEEVSVSGDGSTIVAGCPANECVYIYQITDSGWVTDEEERNGRITASDGFDGLFFGTSVSVSQDGAVIAVGAPKSFSGGWYRGCAYLFEYAGGYWAQSAILEASSPAYSCEMGHSIDISDDGEHVVVGAMHDGNGGGVLYYEKPDGYWISTYETTFFISAEREMLDLLGYSSAISDNGNIIVTGAPQHDVGLNEDQGHTYIFEF